MIRKYLYVGLFAGGFAASPALADKGDFFKMMDTNGDGKVSAEEHAAGAKKMFEQMERTRTARSPPPRWRPVTRR